ncbi:uncharacterized protein LOC126408605 [Epinephelus moara]|uniref:uncharacterized protein LOC126408605 n=1 Tax=Epinephelus moara TaxID=300413 RepID=UPI00214F2DAC|nr:uncharacterized protein LOC126408605 [Epinephelus moara]
MMEIQPEHFNDSVGDSAEQNTMSTSEWDCSHQFVTEVMQAFFRWQAEEEAKINLAGGTPSVAGSYRETLRDNVMKFFDPQRCCTEQQGETFVLSKEQAIVFLEIFERAYDDTEALMQSVQRWEAEEAVECAQLEVEEAECSAVCPTQQKVEAELRVFFDLRREFAEDRGETDVIPAPVSTQMSDRKDEKSAGRRGRHILKRMKPAFKRCWERCFGARPRNRIHSSRTKAAVTADLTSDPLEFVEDLGQDLASPDSVSPTAPVASSKDLFVEDWGQDLDSSACVSHKVVSPTASVASSEDIRSADSADLTAVPQESMAMEGMETPTESSLLADIDATPGPSGAENVTEAAQEVMGDEVIDIRDPFLEDIPDLECDLMLTVTSLESERDISESNAPAVWAWKREQAHRDSESVSQTPALVVSEETAAEQDSSQQTNINKLSVRVLVQKLVTRTFRKARTDTNPRLIADRLFENIWAEIEGEDFEILPKTFKSLDKNVFKDLCQHWGSAQIVLVSMNQDEPRVDNYIASTFKRHLMTPAKRPNVISRFFSRVGKVISQPFTARHRQVSDI